MDPADFEQLRLSLLRFLDANPTGYGLTTAVLTQMARSEGRPGLQAGIVKSELTYLQDKGFVTTVQKSISPDIKAWRITANGRDEYARICGT